MAKSVTPYLLRLDPDTRPMIAQLAEKKLATRFINQAIRFYRLTVDHLDTAKEREPTRNEMLAVRLAHARTAIEDAQANGTLEPDVELVLLALADCLELGLPDSYAGAFEMALRDLTKSDAAKHSFALPS